MGCRERRLRRPACRLARAGAGCVALALGTFGCQLERAAPDTVGEGVARLAARDLALLTSIVNDDATCGFESPLVRGSARGLDGEPGSATTVTWTVRGCVLDFGQETQVSSDCAGRRTVAGGRVLVDATKTVVGRLTGDPDGPVAPDGPESARIDLRVEPSGFWLRRSGAPHRLIHDAPLSASALPKLARSSSSGLCSVPTNDLTLSAITLLPGRRTVDTGERVFPVEVDGSDFRVQLGRWGSEENAIAGRISVWGTPVALPGRDTAQGLDPEYERQAFAETYACKPDLAHPVTFDCVSLTDKLAENTARLVVLAAGVVAKAVNADSDCGFDAARVLLTPSRVEGSVGEPGLLSWKVGGCALELGVATDLSTDCLGGRMVAGGRAVVSAERTVTGLRERRYFVVPSIVPRAADAATIVLRDVALHGLEVSTVAPGASVADGVFTLVEGRLSATVTPYLGERSSAPGEFGPPTPVAVFSGLRLEGARGVLNSGGRAFRVELPSVELEAVNGTVGGRSNVLSGTVQLHGRQVTLRDRPLDPSFAQERFDASYACTEDLRAPLR